jgi:cell wall-associated NlpC family hydrolase
MKREEITTIVYQYFQEKNRAWLHGDLDALIRFHGNQDRDVVLQEIRAFCDVCRLREVKVKKASTEIRVHAINWDDDHQQAVVRVDEKIQWIYNDGPELEDEARLYQHILYIRPDWNQHPVVTCQTWLEHNSHVKFEFPVEAAENDQESASTSEIREPVVTIQEKLGLSRRPNYDRVQALKYAETWWDGYNPAYRKFEVDCTSFVSQCMFAGHAPMVGRGNRAKGWWYQQRGGARDRWSFSWAVAHSLRMFLGGRGYWHAEVVDDPTQLKVGDVICYDWEGDGRWTHNTIVVAFDSQNRPLVNAHTVASRRRFWEYRDSYAWTPKTQYLLFRIPDTF